LVALIVWPQCSSESEVFYDISRNERPPRIETYHIYIYMYGVDVKLVKEENENYFCDVILAHDAILFHCKEWPTKFSFKMI